MKLNGVSISESGIEELALQRLNVPIPLSQPRVLAATREFGAANQPWLWRQVARMTSIDVQVLCWRRSNKRTYPMAPGAVHVVDADPAPYDGPRRWVYRAANATRGNFYAARGQERRDLRELIDRIRPACILCYFGDIALRLVDVAAEARIPVVPYFHGDFQFLSNRWYRWSLQKRLGRFAAVIVVNRLEYEWMLRNGVPENRLHIVPCGAPTDAFVPAREKHDDRLRFVMASRLVEEKGCEISIRAFAEVASRVSGVSLDIYGDGPMRGALEQLVADLGLRKLVEFHGYVEERALFSRLPLGDIFIQHSLEREGSPVSVIEAMSCGLPVVATPVGGIVDQVICGNTGILVAERDLEGMIEAMCVLARDPGLRRMFGRNGRLRATQSFDSYRLSDRLEGVLRDVACGATASAGRLEGK